MGFWSRLTGRAPAPPAASERASAARPAPVSHAPTAAAPTAAAPAGLVLPPAVPQQQLALRLLQQLTPGAAALQGRRPEGLAAVAALDAVLREPQLDERWLPRAAALIPQLMRLLRQEDASPLELEQRVSRDVVLSAEVLRLAAGSHYASRGAVRDLRDALERLGHSGLQRALARVVLRPVFKPEADPQLAPLQQLLQQHSDWQADALADAAVLQHLDPFDGYLAGLLHGAGWQALLRIVSAASAWGSVPAEPAVAEALALRAHRLFGRAAEAWSLSPAFADFARSAASGSAADALSQAWAQVQPQTPVLK